MKPPIPALPVLLTGAVLIGFAPLFVRLADVGPSAVGFWRAVLALPLLAALHQAQGGRWDFWGERGTRLLWLAGACFGLDLVFWHQSIHHTSVANATLMSNLAPIFVALLAFVLSGTRQTRGFLAGLALALAGAALLVADSFQLSMAGVKGDLLGAVSAFWYAGYLVAVGSARTRYSAVQVMLVSSLATALVCGAAALLAGETLLPSSARGWLVLLGLAWFSHCAGQGSIAWALAHLPAAFSSVALLVQPAAAALFAWWLLGEGFGLWQALGGAVVLAGIVICRLSSLPPPKPSGGA